MQNVTYGNAPKIKTFGYLLGYFQEVLGINEPDSFIEFIGLTHVLHPHDYEALLAGEAVPDPSLRQYFEQIMPANIMSQDELSELYGELEWLSIIHGTVHIKNKGYGRDRAIAETRQRVATRLNYREEILYPDLGYRNELVRASRVVVGHVDAENDDQLQAATDEAFSHKHTKRTERDPNIARARQEMSNLSAITPQLHTTDKVQRFSDALRAILSNRNNKDEVIYGDQGQTLRLTQQEILVAFHSAVSSGVMKANGVAPGGSGKTLVGVVLSDAAYQAGMRTLYIVPSRLAVDGAYDELKAHRKGIKVGKVYQGAHEIHADVVVITYASFVVEFYKFLAAQTTGKKTNCLDLKSFGLILPDEGHSYLTWRAQKILGQTDAIILSYTATPFYSVDKHIEQHFGKTVYELPFMEAVRRNECAPPEWRRCVIDVSFDLLHLRKTVSRTGEYTGEGQKELNSSKWNSAVVALYRDYVDAQGKRIFGEKAIAFCGGVGHADSLADEFNKQLMPLLRDKGWKRILRSNGVLNPDLIKHIALPYHRSRSSDENSKAWRMFKNGEVLLLTSSKLLAQSVNRRDISVILNAAPVFSIPFAAQRALRGSRTLEGKERFVVLDMVPSNTDESGVNPVLFAHYAFEALKRYQGGGKTDFLNGNGTHAASKAALNGVQSQTIGGVLSIDTKWDLDAVVDAAEGKRSARVGKTTHHTSAELREAGYIPLANAYKIVDKNTYRFATSYWLQTHLKDMSKEYGPRSPECGHFIIPAFHGRITCIADEFDRKREVFANAAELRTYLHNILPTTNDPLSSAEHVLAALMQAGYQFKFTEQFIARLNGVVSNHWEKERVIGVGPQEIEHEGSVLRVRRLTTLSPYEMIFDLASAMQFSVKYFCLRINRVNTLDSHDDPLPAPPQSRSSPTIRQRLFTHSSQ